MDRLTTTPQASAAQDIFAQDARGWMLEEEAYDPATETHMATLMATGNRYLGLRGSFEEIGSPGVQGCFAAGVFVKMRNYYWPHADTFFKKKMVFDEELMKDERRDKSILNIADPLFIRLWIDQVPVRMFEGKILDYRRTLDLRTGLVTRRLRWDDGTGRVTRLCVERFCSMDDPHRICIRYSATPENYSAVLTLQSGIDTRVATCGRDDLFTVALEHFDPARGGVRLSQCTSEPRVEIALGTANRLQVAEQTVQPQWSLVQHEGRLFYAQTQLQAQACTSVTLEKSFHVYESNQTSQPHMRLEKALAQALDETFDSHYARHCSVWSALWNSSDIRLDGPVQAQRDLRFCLFHMLICAPLDGRASIGAKSLTGEGYKGYVFWDTDAYLAPFYYFTMPQVGRHLIEFRYHGLDAARQFALHKGLRGARYPWEAADTGEEECWQWLPSGVTQVHVVSDVAWSILRYGWITGQRDLLEGRGFEIVLECARLFASLATWNDERGCYEILNAGGPDEYHPIADNNAYTNYSVKLLLEHTLEQVAWLRRTDPEAWDSLVQKIELTENELELWDKIARGMVLPFDPQTGLIEQIEGFFKLQRHWEKRGASYGGPSAEYHLCQGQKQPDTLLLLALHPDLFDDRVKLANWDYYEPTTQHGSSLSPSIHAILAAQLGMRYKAEQYFQHCIRLDLDNINGDSGAGIHIANCAGAWLAMVQGFAGLNYQPGRLTVNPIMPLEWNAIELKLIIQGVQYGFECRLGRVVITRLAVLDETAASEPLVFRVAGHEYTFGPDDQTLTIEC